jgi:CubicO group peptidase (beta-lactamase class C family)
MKPTTRRRHLGGLAATTLTVGLLGPLGKRATADQQADLAVLAEGFMDTYGVPGLAVAFARGGAIVCSEAFGVADLETGERLGTSHRFRIASVSKPITATAIFLLAERGRLKLDDRVLGKDGILGLPGPGDVTVRHLLNHTSGGWENDGRDPMFRRISLGHPELIAWTLETRPLDHAPGAHYAYSNFGYCLLGRVIEKVSGKPYETYVREAVLEPCGVKGMQISGAEPLAREVTYHTDGKPDTFSMNVRRMDSHGGWVGTPTDMVRFATRVDGFDEPADILKEESVATMTERGGVNERYACGWSVNKRGHYWHGGSLPGLTTILVRTSTGYCWAACANTRSKGCGLALDQLMWKMKEVLPSERGHPREP